MSQKSKQAAYCTNCTKNVPHLRTTNGPVATFCCHWFGGMLDLLRIGPWYCLHCEKKSWVLPLTNEDAADYRIVDPLDMSSDGKSSIWFNAGAKVSSAKMDADQQSNPGSMNPNHSPSTNASESDLNSSKSEAHVLKNPTCENIRFSNQNLNSKSAMMLDQDQYALDTSNRPIDRGNEEFGSAAELESLLRIDDMARQSENQMPEAESVGNFIKDRSLILRSTRMHRVSEKYRDSIVERILSGKVSISQLTGSGEYTEGELISWIADRVKRLSARLEMLEDENGVSNGNPKQRIETWGPFGP